MRRDRGLTACAALVALITALPGLIGPSSVAAATGPPTLRLVAASGHLTVVHRRHQSVSLDPGVYVTPAGGTFRLEVSRPDYAFPARVRQVWTDEAGSHHRRLPSTILHGWRGLEDFLHVVVRNASGKEVRRAEITFCPNSFQPQRLKPTAVDEPTFPDACRTFTPFVVASVWGIDRGWGVDPFQRTFFFGSSYRISFRAPDGEYRVKTSIGSRYVRLFGIDPDRATTTVDLTVETGRTVCPPYCGSTPTPAGSTWGPGPSVGLAPPPPPDDLPDLRSLPAFGMFPYWRNGRDFLSFSTTEWVGGASDLDVEGFRRRGTDLMDAYQFFYRDGEVIGRAPVGTMEFDDRRGHHHWHFEQFARYRLLDASQTSAVRSHKQSFCIAPTDGVDLLLPAATLRPGPLGFLSCGSATAVWVRERMPVGWGDTYVQFSAGQAFDITDVPNGTYYVEVTVNPKGLLYEQDTTNNVALRKVILRGRRGSRRICVPALYGVDQEGACPRAA